MSEKVLSDCCIYLQPEPGFELWSLDSCGGEIGRAQRMSLSLDEDEGVGGCGTQNKPRGLDPDFRCVCRPA